MINNSDIIILQTGFEFNECHDKRRYRDDKD